ncbi:hypothetical protein ONZ51_g9346 [Trametes cubensis]|uniref:Uncharacterized protein n=1 Tax=Trametes cubensis TaxID=1111947 RepID=A0AAD7TND7_9APHY|nr:hypothetical protein ONZ51_g9346 [Trametes cubensis]
MESLNLNNLASSLPSSSYANAEKELTNNFRGTHHLPIAPSHAHPLPLSAISRPPSTSNHSLHLPGGADAFSEESDCP